MFEKLKTIFKGKEPAPTRAEPRQSGPKAPVRTEEKPKADKPKAFEAKGTIRAAVAAKKPQTPEELCAITPKMGKDEVREKLALLYKRYNRATSSLDAGLRAEAEEMLDAIVMIREKVFGAI